MSSVVHGFEQQFVTLKAQKRRQLGWYGSLFVMALLLSAWVGDFSPLKIWYGLPRIHEYVFKTLPVLSWNHLWADLAEWFWGLRKWLGLLLETVLIAYLATLLGTLGALALAFDASNNLQRSPWAYAFTRRLLELARTIPELVFALIFVFAFGLGPMAGVLAIALHTMGGSGKLFAEAVENIDMKSVDGLRATGASWLQLLRFAVLPQVFPNFTSFSLWRFEINVRSASVLGFVGAGGIGQEFYTAIRMLYYEDISAILLLLIATVMLIDMGCEKLRHHLIGRDSLS